MDYAPGIPATRDVIPHVWQCSFGFCGSEAYSGAQNYISSGAAPAPIHQNHTHQPQRTVLFTNKCSQIRPILTPSSVIVLPETGQNRVDLCAGIGYTRNRTAHGQGLAALEAPNGPIIYISCSSFCIIITGRHTRNQRAIVYCQEAQLQLFPVVQDSLWHQAWTNTGRLCLWPMQSSGRLSGRAIATSWRRARCNTHTAPLHMPACSLI